MAHGFQVIAVVRRPLNYRRVMRISALIRAAAPLAGVVLVLGGCAAEDNTPPAAAGPCSIIENGTPAPKARRRRPVARPAQGRPDSSERAFIGDGDMRGSKVTVVE